MEKFDKSILSHIPRRSFFNHINNNNNSILNIHHTILININPKNFHNSLQIIQQDNDLSSYLFDNFSNNNVFFLELRKSHPVPAASQLGSRRTEASKTDDAVASGKRVLQDYSRVLSDTWHSEAGNREASVSSAPWLPANLGTKVPRKFSSQWTLTIKAT